MKLYVVINSMSFLASDVTQIWRLKIAEPFSKSFNISDISYHNGCIIEDLVKHDNEVQHYIAATSSKTIKDFAQELRFIGVLQAYYFGYLCDLFCVIFK